MPVAPFQYLNSHDHSHLIVSAGVTGNDEWSSGDRSKFYLLQAPAIALYTLQGVPMLWQGEEFGEDYNLPGSGPARINWRRDTHWEYFYDDYGGPLIRLYRRLGQLRRSSRALRSRSSFFFWQQSLAGNQIIAYQRHAAAIDGQPEEFAMIFLNFGDAAASIQVAFPKAGAWAEKLDEDIRTLQLNVGSDGDSPTVTVPSHYGLVFLQAP
jgi:1,4-alpha-glucan branching enzyme